MAQNGNRKGNNDTRAEPRDTHGRFAKRRQSSLPAISGTTAAIGAAVLAAGIGVSAALFQWRKGTAHRDQVWPAGNDEDFYVEAPSEPRPPEQFRPDRDAAVPAGKLDAFAPATVPVPSRAQARGNGDA